MTTETTKRSGLYVEVPDEGLRWTMRRVAAERRTTVRELVLAILSAWLEGQGYGLGDRAEAHP